MTTSGFAEYWDSWVEEDDGTYSKIQVAWVGKTYKIERITVYETGVSKEEYFKRKLANTL